MITPSWATIAIIASALFLLVIIPLLDGSHRFGKYISLRYTLVVVALTCVLGCILDFSHLQESSRNIVLCGGLALTGLFVVVRSLEKSKSVDQSLFLMTLQFQQRKSLLKMVIRS